MKLYSFLTFLSSHKQIQLTNAIEKTTLMFDDRRKELIEFVKKNVQKLHILFKSLVFEQMNIKKCYSVLCLTLATHLL